MNEKSLDVLRQYDLNVYRVARGRGGMVLNTDNGIKLFLECARPDKYYEREDLLTQAVADNGFKGIDTYIRNTQGSLVTPDDEGRRFVLKDWFDGRECNVKDLSDISNAVKTLGKLHTIMTGVSGDMMGQSQVIMLEAGSEQCHDPQIQAPQMTEMRNTYIRHMKELKLAWNYLRNKKRRSEFEQIAYRNIGSFYEEAVNAVDKLNNPILDERFEDAKKSGELCHGSYNYHNILFGSGVTAVTNFDKYKNECQISDLYQFMRKILEKYDWDIQVAYKMMDEYDKVKPITDTDLEMLGALFAFPEKFWKVINYYFNGSKSWIPPKSIEKLSMVVEQNDKRKEFLATVM